MIIRKKNDETFGVYVAELSMSQLQAMRKAFAANHADVVADEMFQALNFYLDRVPEPGQSKDEAKAEIEKSEANRADSLLPEPPSDGQDSGQPPGEPPADGAPPTAPKPDAEKPASYDDLVKGGADAGLPPPPEIPAE